MCIDGVYCSFSDIYDKSTFKRHRTAVRCPQHVAIATPSGLSRRTALLVRGSAEGTQTGRASDAASLPGACAAETIEAKSRLREDRFSTIRRSIARLWAKNRRKSWTAQTALQTGRLLSRRLLASRDECTGHHPAFPDQRTRLRLLAGAQRVLAGAQRARPRARPCGTRTGAALPCGTDSGLSPLWRPCLSTQLPRLPSLLTGANFDQGLHAESDATPRIAESENVALRRPGTRTGARRFRPVSALSADPASSRRHG